MCSAQIRRQEKKGLLISAPSSSFTISYSACPHFCHPQKVHGCPVVLQSCQTSSLPLISPPRTATFTHQITVKQLSLTYTFYVTQSIGWSIPTVRQFWQIHRFFFTSLLFHSFKLEKKGSPGLLEDSFSWLNPTFAVWAVCSQYSRWWDIASIGASAVIDSVCVI